MSVNVNNFVNKSLIAEAQKSFSNDGRLDKKEFEILKKMINSSDLSPQVKDGAIKFLAQTKKASNGFLGIFGKNISNSELGKLKELATSLGDNPIAKEFCKTLETSLAKPATDKNQVNLPKSNSLEPSSNFISNLFSGKKDESNITSKNGKSQTNIPFTSESNKESNKTSFKKGDDWNGGKVLAVNVDPTGYRNVNKGIEGGIYDTKFSPEHHKNLQSKEKKGKIPAGSAEAYKKEHLLQNLQEYLAGNADHVSVAFDKNLYANGTIKKGQKFRIPELEKAYGKSPIIFRADDTGGDFTGKGLSRMDICTKDEKDPKTGHLYESDPRLNLKGLTLVKMP
ncbi:MAG: hypothetical protein AABZ74_16010 [Cyanobacteriota bacterium]